MMASKKITRCDRCDVQEETLDKNNPNSWIGMKFYRADANSPTVLEYGLVDLCFKCKQELREWWGKDNLPKGLG
jgi:hypothetical protein